MYSQKARHPKVTQRNHAAVQQCKHEFARERDIKREILKWD